QWSVRERNFRISYNKDIVILKHLKKIQKICHDFLNEIYINLMENWDANLLNRPCSKGIEKSIDDIRDKEGRKEICFPDIETQAPIRKIKAQAIYSSRPLSSLINTAL
ncbi:1108_t:CDS:2, partial [Scutellospora calospora]